MIEGVDLSHWTPLTDAHALRAAGVRFAYTKASEHLTDGRWYVDPTYASNRGALERAGVVVGAYHFARPAVSSATFQAARFLATIGGVARGELTPALDMEDRSSGLDWAQLAGWALDFLGFIRGRTRRTPVLYADRDYLAHLCAASRQLAVDLARGDVHLWLADLAPVPARPCTFQQYSWTGTVAGVEGTGVDLDRFLGTPAQWAELTGEPANVPTRPAPSPTGGIRVHPIDLVNVHADPRTYVRGAGVRPMQRLLGVTADGIAGPSTRAALVHAQAAHHLAVDAVFGAETATALLADS